MLIAHRTLRWDDAGFTGAELDTCGWGACTERAAQTLVIDGQPTRLCALHAEDHLAFAFASTA